MQCYQDNQMKVGRIVGTGEIREMYTKFYPENLSYGIGTEDSGVNGRIIIKWFLKRKTSMA